MTDSGVLLIEPLGANHDKSSFSCGEESLNRYLAHQAGQDIKRNTSRVFVATPATSPGPVIGYYTLSALSIHLSSLPPAVAKKLPRHPIPAALLGRLAVSEKHQSDGIGKLLLADAVKRCLTIEKEIAIYALVTDPISEKAMGFYEHFGFRPLMTEKPRLFLPLKPLQS